MVLMERRTILGSNAAVGYNVRNENGTEEVGPAVIDEKELLNLLCMRLPII